MSKHLFITLLLSIPFAACSQSGRSIVVADGPSAPINQPDTRVIEPTPDPTNPPTQPAGSGNPNQGGGSSNPGSGSGPSGPTTGSPSSSGGGGGGGGSPVPEPGTLLLFGSGLAGLAGFSMRRRRREE